MATSQEPLRIPQESVWQVAPLAVPPPDAPRDAAQLASFEAAQLFADRAAAARPGFAISERNAMAVADICRALDGVPLAIELAAARVSVLSAEQIAARLATASRCWVPATGPRRRGSGRCGPPSTGVITCSPRPSRSCCAACPCSRLVPGHGRAGLRRRRAARRGRGRPDRGTGGQVAGGGRAGGARPGPLPDAGQHPRTPPSASRKRAKPRRPRPGCATTPWPCANATRRSGWPPSRPAGRWWSPCSAATTWTSPTCARSSVAAWPAAARRPGCASAPRSGHRRSSGARSTRGRAGSPASCGLGRQAVLDRVLGTALIGRAQAHPAQRPGAGAGLGPRRAGAVPGRGPARLGRHSPERAG